MGRTMIGGRRRCTAKELVDEAGLFEAGAEVGRTVGVLRAVVLENAGLHAHHHAAREFLSEEKERRRTKEKERRRELELELLASRCCFEYRAIAREYTTYMSVLLSEWSEVADFYEDRYREVRRETSGGGNEVS
jgi:hypothetical protein